MDCVRVAQGGSLSTLHRIAAQHTKTPYPSRRLPPTNSNGDDENDGTDDGQSPPPRKTLSSHKTEKHPPRKKVPSLQKVTLFAKSIQIGSTSVGCVPTGVTVLVP